MTGSVVVYSAGATPEDGVDMFLSPDLHTKVIKAVSKCQGLDSACVQKTQDLLRNQNTEIHARQLGLMELLIAAAVALFGIISAGWYFITNYDQVPTHMHITQAQITQVVAVSSATLTVVSIDNKDAFTITPKPQATQFTASQLPAVTQYASEIGGHAKGDVLITLQPDFAKRLSEFIHRSSECSPSPDFTKILEKRTGNFLNVFCATHAVIINATPGGVFEELRAFRPQAPLQFGGEDAIRALNAAMAFARNFAPHLKLSPSDAAAFATIVFAIAWQANLSGTQLAAENVIPAKALVAQITQINPSPTPTECKKCYASCTFVGALERCGTKCSTTTVCDSTSSSRSISTTAVTAWTVFPRATTVPIEKTTPRPDKCEGESSGLPNDIFKKLYKDFCSQVADRGGYVRDVYWTVDNNGLYVGPKRRDLEGQVPPPKTNDWPGWRVQFIWNVRGMRLHPLECERGCSESFDTLADGDCGKFGQGNSMSLKGSYYVTCGTYNFEIIPPETPTTPLVLSEQHFHDENKWGRHRDVHARKQEEYARKMCNNIAFYGGSDYKSNDVEVWTPSGKRDTQIPISFGSPGTGIVLLQAHCRTKTSQSGQIQQ